MVSANDAQPRVPPAPSMLPFSAAGPRPSDPFLQSRAVQWNLGQLEPPDRRTTSSRWNREIVNKVGF